MKRSNKKIPVSVLVMFVAALVLLGFSAVQGARAALSVFSEEYDATLDTLNIGVALVDGEGTVLSGDDSVKLPTEVKDGKETVVIGKKYPLEVSVKNTYQTESEDAIDEYVRVDVYKYWVDDNGEKAPALDPKLIKLTFNTSDWIEDENLRTDERSVWYYKKILPVGETTTPFLKTITLSTDINKLVTREDSVDSEGYTVTTITYVFNEKTYKVDIQADAVQTHNAKDAIKSAWGGNVSIDGSGNITSVN